MAAHHTHKTKGAALKNILVLFDSISIRKEAAKYSVELAKRTDCELIILMLLASEMSETVPGDFDGLDDATQLRIREEFALQAKHMEQAGISV